jgi:arylsulfatase
VSQSAIHGASLANTLDDPKSPAKRSTQYFEMLGHRAIYKDGWRAVCPWPGPSFAEAGMGFGQPITSDTLSELDATGWELYHVAEDFAETKNVAAENRDRLIAMIGTWYVEAGKYNVMPVDGSGLARMVGEKPQIALPRDSYTYLPNTQSVPNFAAPKVLNRPHSITADVEIPEDGAEGVLLSQGTAAGGYTFFVKDGKLRYVHNYVGRRLLGVESDTPVPAGKHELRFEFEPTGPPDLPNGKGAPGRLQLYVDGKLVGNAEADLTTPFMFNPGVLTCGANPGSPVSPDYVGPFTFTGTLHSVTLDVSGELIHDPEAELRAHLARQ